MRHLFILLLLVACAEPAIQPNQAKTKQTIKTTGAAAFVFDGKQYSGTFNLNTAGKTLTITDPINQIEVLIKNLNASTSQPFINYMQAGSNDVCMTVVFTKLNKWYYSTFKGSIELKTESFEFNTELLQYCTVGVDCQEIPIYHTITGSGS